MEATSKYRRYRKGVSSPTNTAMHDGCYSCTNICSSQPNGEAKVTCRGCKAEFPVPSRTTSYCCPVCHNVCYSTLQHGKSREEGQICCPVKKIGTKLFKLGHLNSANKNGNLLSSSSPLVAFSSSLSCRYNKRAVLCGVSYNKRKLRLKGTINDIKNMRELLIKNFKFPNECIRVLTEQEQNANLIPTKHNILESLRWLVKDCQEGDSLVFYFSGHGSQQPDFKEDEIDGFDETLCPVDFMNEGMIVDNDINSTIVWPLKNGVTLHAIIDTCHSGTILDLLYVYNHEIGIWEDNKPPSKEPIRKHTSGGVAICLSACEDSQTAADSTVFGGKGMNGVLTYLFTKTIREYPEITYGRLLEKMHEEIQKIKRSRCHNRILQRIFHRRIAQDPLISSSEKFDVSTTIFTL
ncbi:metacaspase-1-like [Gastrolobium bilobum]|uniref:metacaspase-1-like n=1 Tax=Gastrolobium bilobum TaxID=150636 RepID=UPI002AB1C331|nr:metacaspase-1-like [Gastrolobium bilobum]